LRFMNIVGLIATVSAAVALSITPALKVYTNASDSSEPVRTPTQFSPNPATKTVSQGEITSAQYVPPKVTPAPTPNPAPKPVSVGAPPDNTQIMGDKNDWLAASGISPSDWTYVDFIISKESGWNPNSTNSTTGAHGLPQADPYSKTGCGWVDAVCQLRWANGYATSRYGSWAAAYDFWLQHGYW
jgi:hypothetical protein